MRLDFGVGAFLTYGIAGYARLAIGYVPICATRIVADTPRCGGTGRIAADVIYCAQHCRDAAF